MMKILTHIRYTSEDAKIFVEFEEFFFLFAMIINRKMVIDLIIVIIWLDNQNGLWGYVIEGEKKLR